MKLTLYNEVSLIPAIFSTKVKIFGLRIVKGIKCFRALTKFKLDSKLSKVIGLKLFHQASRLHGYPVSVQLSVKFQFYGSSLI